MSLLTKTFSLIRRYARPTLQNSVPLPRAIARWVAPTLKELKRRRDKISSEPENPRSSYLEWNYEAELFAFGKRLGEQFDRKLLKKALIQKEYANLHELKTQEAGANVSEKLENNHDFIKDGEAFITAYIRSHYSKMHPEIIVNAIQEYLMSETMLAHIAKHIGLTDLILTNEYPVVEKTLSDTFKAIVSALKTSTDQKGAEKFIQDFVLSQMSDKEIFDIWEPKDPYEYLKKMLNEKGIKDVEPRICNESASNTILASFQVGIYTNKKLLGLGWGESIHIAKDTAALDAIYKIYNQDFQTK